MRIVIIANVKEKENIWAHGLGFDGRLLRFITPHPLPIGEVWVLNGELAHEDAPGQPPVFTVQDKRGQPPLQGIPAFAAGKLPALSDHEVSPAAENGLTHGPCCWQPAAPLKKEETTRGSTYHLPDGTTLAYVGTSPPLPQIEAGTLLYLVGDGDGRTAIAGWITDTTPQPDFDWEMAPPEEEYFPFPDMIAEPTPRETYASPLAALKKVFGYNAFRPLQEPIIQNVLTNKDSLAVMPTGSGKSLCYQLPALLLDGLTVVVSPLISLMEDQVAQLRAWGIPAAYLNSSLPPAGQAAVMDDVRAGRLRLLYAAPETLLQIRTRQLLAAVNVSCLTIDEAHCISQWGHDFRPEYQQLADLRAELPGAVCLALTATATPRVRADILRSLGIPAAQEFISSFDRDNLRLLVEPKVDVAAQTINFLNQRKGQSGIIYCATRRQVNTVSELLHRRGWEVRPYHAGLENGTRRDNQTAFIRDDVSIIVATIAFGMGIDKPDVRFILHVDLPQDIESYYQQIGRAGRDGLPADCLLLYSHADTNTIKHFIRQSPPDLQRGAYQRLEAMIAFAQTGVCRRRPLLAYFDEEYAADNCDMCDNCLREDEELADLTIPAQKFLSCVKRTGELFGMIYIIYVLRGSKKKEILKRGHHQISTYNIGADLSKAQWRHLATQFVQQGLLQQNQHGGLAVTAAGWAVLRGQETVLGTPLPEAVRKQTMTTRQDIPADYDLALFERLRETRKALADEENVPPYVIFPDRTLIEMAAYFPQSENSFADLYGVGQTKLRRYAPPFLEVIGDYCTEHGIAEQEKGSEPPAEETVKPLGTRTQLVGEYLREGITIAEIAAEMGVKPGTVLGHVEKLGRAGKPVPMAELRASSALDEAEQNRVFAAFTAEGHDLLRPVFEALGKRVSYDELRLQRILFLAAKDMSGS